MANNSSKTSKLRIGILADDVITTKYVYEIVEWAKNQHSLETSCIILHAKPRLDKCEQKTRAGKIIDSLIKKGINETLSILIFYFVNKIEKIQLSKHSNHKSHLYKYDLSLFGIQTISISPIVSKSGFVYRFSDDDILNIKKQNLDLLIRCGGAILRGSILSAARFGVIAFHHADNRINRGGPAGFWEVYKNQSATGFILQQLTEELDGGNVLLRGRFPTQPYYLLNQAYLFDRSNYYLKKILLTIASARALPDFMKNYPYSEQLYRTPKAHESLCYLAKTWSSRVCAGFVRKTGKHPRWAVSYVLSDWHNAVLWRGIEIPNQPFCYLSEPFVVIKNGRNYCFLQEYDYLKRKGKIVVYEIAGNICERIGTVLEASSHVSFPYLFEYRDGLYMCPNLPDSKEIGIYKCHQFPLQWKLEKVIMKNVSAANSMLFEMNGKWWLFTNIDPFEGNEHSTELAIFSSDSPLSDVWTQHQGNPIYIDSEIAINTGLLKSGNKYYRVSTLSGSSSVHKEANIYEIKDLSDSSYVESHVSTISPNFHAKLKATNTLNSNGIITVYDYMRIININS